MQRYVTQRNAMQRNCNLKNGETVRQVPDEALERARNLRQISRTVHAAQRREADEYIARQVR